jgi:hypothetical protein
VIAFGIQWVFDGHTQAAERRGLKNKVQSIEDRRRLPLACLAGPFLVLSFFWTGASASRPESVPVSVPILGLIPFGIGYNLIFISLSNYIIDSYEFYAASAMAATSASRSLLAAGLPMCTHALYGELGLEWGFYFLGFLMVGLSIIPFAFLRFGPRIRARSKLFQELGRRKEGTG